MGSFGGVEGLHLTENAIAVLSVGPFGPVLQSLKLIYTVSANFGDGMAHLKDTAIFPMNDDGIGGHR